MSVSRECSGRPSPACTELEQHVRDWLAAFIGLPERFTFAGTGSGVVQHSASTAMLVTILAALHRASGGQVVRNGIGRGRYVVYTFTAANFGRCRWSVGSGVEAVGGDPLVRRGRVAGAAAQ